MRPRPSRSIRGLIAIAANFAAPTVVNGPMCVAAWDGMLYAFALPS